MARKRTSPSAWSGESELIETCARVFQDKGFAATSMRDLADALGILRGSIYHYIETKEDLLYEVVKEVHQRAIDLLERCEAMQAERSDAVTILGVFIRGHIDLVLDLQTKVAVCLQDYRSLGDERRTLVEEQRERYMAFLAGVMAQGQREGTIDPQYDTRLAAVSLVGVMNLTHTWYQPSGALSQDSIAEFYTRFILRGLSPDPAFSLPSPDRAASLAG